MRADRRDKNHRVFRVAKRATRCEVVGGGARGRGDADAVGLDGGEVVVVAEELDGGHGGVGPAVDDDVVEDFEGRGGFVRVLVFELGA